MTLDQNTQSEIIKVTDKYWDEHVGDTGFIQLVAGKEPGHRMADYVDDKTTSLMKIHFDTRYEANMTGQTKKRSMGDVWVHSLEIFNPVNIKSGEQDMSGQPNVVSMQKLLDYLFRAWIDSYYLLIVKFAIADQISHCSYLIDLLDWTEFITYDAGPGQIMLKERDFYAAYRDGFRPEERSIPEKIESLFKLFESGVESLFSNRKLRLSRQRKLLDEFSDEFIVDQSEMYFIQ